MCNVFTHISKVLLNFCIITGWLSDSSGGAPAYQMQGPEFNLQYGHKEKENNLYNQHSMFLKQVN
jgi:hypothetical protein